MARAGTAQRKSGIVEPDVLTRVQAIVETVTDSSAGGTPPATWANLWKVFPA